MYIIYIVFIVSLIYLLFVVLNSKSALIFKDKNFDGEAINKLYLRTVTNDMYLLYAK